MERKFIERLTILIVIFLGVSIATGFIIGNYISMKKVIEKEKENSLILKSY